MPVISLWGVFGLTRNNKSSKLRSGFSDQKNIGNDESVYSRSERISSRRKMFMEGISLPKFLLHNKISFLVSLLIYPLYRQGEGLQRLPVQ